MEMFFWSTQLLVLEEIVASEKFLATNGKAFKDVEAVNFAKRWAELTGGSDISLDTLVLVKTVTPGVDQGGHQPAHFMAYAAFEWFILFRDVQGSIRRMVAWRILERKSRIRVWNLMTPSERSRKI